MKNLIILIFVDTSGSMEGQRTAAVSTALTESLSAIGNIDHKVAVVIADCCYFDESVRWIHPEATEDGLVLKENANTKPRPDEDGLHHLTSYYALYRELAKFLEKLKRRQDQIAAGAKEPEQSPYRSKDLYLFLLSDGKPVDTGRYEAMMRRCIDAMAPFNVTRHAVRIGMGGEEGEAALREFAGTPDHVIDLPDMPEIFSRIKIWLTSS